jgi:hypothetical protein
MQWQHVPLARCSLQSYAYAKLRCLDSPSVAAAHSLAVIAADGLTFAPRSCSPAPLVLFWYQQQFFVAVVARQWRECSIRVAEYYG